MFTAIPRKPPSLRYRMLVGMNHCTQSAPPLIRRTLRAAAVSGLAFLGLMAGPAAAITVDINAPSIDKNGYPNSPSGGGPRQSAFIFGVIGVEDTDERDSQFFNRFTTSGVVPTGQGFANYQITSATFTLTVQTASTFVFDGTYDSITTYDEVGLPTNGDDPGRPIELYGAAFRNGTDRGFTNENLSYGTISAKGQRNIYATDFQAGALLTGANRDVSNNVSAAFEAIPFAIGQISPSSLNPDGTVMAEADVVFTLNLLNPDVLRYLQLSLDSGLLDLVASSLHPGAQGEDPTYPDFFTKESLIPGALPGRLDMEVTIVPEASAVTSLLCAFGQFVGCWRGRQAFQPGGSKS